MTNRMKRRAAFAAWVLAAISSAPATALAQPGEPEPGAPCPSAAADAMTWPPDDTMPLVCAAQPGAGDQWQTITSPYPISDRWLSYGPPMKLHGEGLRNSSIRSGAWLAVPQDPDGRCRAEQLAVIPGQAAVGPPQVDESAAGQPLAFEIVPKLFSITMSGYCLWEKTG